MNPRVSVILPFYNREEVLSRAITSVLHQSFEDFELLLVDDGSSDGSRAIAASCSDARARVMASSSNLGVASARNTGLSIAMGEYIAFQDSDDEWLPSKLEMQVRFLDENRAKYGAIFGGKILIGMDNNHKYGDDRISYIPKNHGDKEINVSQRILVENVISPQTLVFKRMLLGRVGLFDERLKNNNDWEFMLRLSQSCRIHYMRSAVVVAYVSDNSVSKNRVWATDSLALIAEKHRELLRRAPRSYASLLRRVGNGLFGQRNYREAIQYHSKALIADPRQVKSWVRLLLSGAVFAVTSFSRFGRIKVFERPGR